MAQLRKNLPAMQETWVWSLGWDNPLEKRKAAHSIVLAWSLKESDTRGHFHFLSLFTGACLNNSAALVSAMQRHEPAVCTRVAPRFGFPSHLAHHGAPSRVPCAAQDVLTSCLFYTQWCVMLLILTFQCHVIQLTPFLQCPLHLVF